MLNNRGRSNSRKNKKSEVSVLGEGTFLGLQFAHYVEEYKDSSEVVTINPTVTFVPGGDVVIFDYGNAVERDDTEEIKVFFENTVSAGDTITVTNGEYTNPLTGDAKRYDISGTYVFTKFDSNNFLVFLTKTSVNNQSQTYNRYDNDKFLSESIQWTTTSNTTKTTEINEILNIFGSDSSNSFSNTFVEGIEQGDIIELQIGQSSDISTFTLLDYYIDDSSVEHLVIEEDIPEHGTTMVGEEIFVRVLRNELTKPHKKVTWSCCDSQLRCSSGGKKCRNYKVRSGLDPSRHKCWAHETPYMGPCDGSCCNEDLPTNDENSMEGDSRVLDGYPATALTPDEPVSQNHLNWFLWFYSLFTLYPTTSEVDPSLEAYPPRVQTSYNILRNITNNNWQQDGLNAILDQWGSGGYPSPSVIPSGSNLTIPPRRTAQRPQLPFTTTDVANRSAIRNSARPRNGSSDELYERWIQSGRITYNVIVKRRKKNGSYINVFYINGMPNKNLVVSPGTTFRFKQSDKSNTTSGHTNSNHPIGISTEEDGKGIEFNNYTQKGTLGRTRNPYTYVTVGNEDLYYYCKQHPGMGGVIHVPQTKRDDEAERCGPGESCYARRKKAGGDQAECWAVVPMGCDGKCGDGIEDGKSPIEYSCAASNWTPSEDCRICEGDDNPFDDDPCPNWVPCLAVRLVARTPCGATDDYGNFVCGNGHKNAGPQGPYCSYYTVENLCDPDDEGWDSSSICCGGDDSTSVTPDTPRRRTTGTPTPPSRNNLPRTTPPPTSGGSMGGMSSGY